MANSHVVRRSIGYAVVLMMIVFGLLTAVRAQQVPPPNPPVSTGQFVDLGGRRLHFSRSGAGSPAVVVENGTGGFSVEWALVQPEVAKFTEICTYDRAGYAWSDRGPTQDTIEETIDDLHLLLLKTGIRPPYVMVGASLGAIYVRAYQRRFPEQVVGMVFVDGSHDEAITFMAGGRRRPISELSAEELLDAYRTYEHEAPRPKIGPADQEPLDRLPPDLQKARHWAFSKLVAEVGLLPKGAAAAESWRQEFTPCGGNARAPPTHSAIFRWSSWSAPKIAVTHGTPSKHRWRRSQAPANWSRLKPAAT